MNASNSSNSSSILPPFTPVELDYFQACVALVLGIVGFLTNLLILILVAHYKKLQQRLMYLSLHIVVIDIVYTLTVPPAIFISGVAGEWLLGAVMCNILGMIHDFFAMFRFFMTLVLTIDRFTSVFWPFYYDQHSLRIIVPLLSVVYVVSILRVVLPLSGVFSCFQFIPTFKTCTAGSGSSDECFWFVVVNISFIVFFGVVIPLVLYTVLFCKTWAVKRRLEKSRPKSRRMAASIALIMKDLVSDQSIPSIGPCEDGGRDVIKEAFESKSSREPDSNTVDTLLISPCASYSQTLLTAEEEQLNVGSLEEGTVSVSNVILEEKGCELEQTGDDKFELEGETFGLQSADTSATQSADIGKDEADSTQKASEEITPDKKLVSSVVKKSPAQEISCDVNTPKPPPVAKQGTRVELQPLSFGGGTGMEKRRGSAGAELTRYHFRKRKSTTMSLDSIYSSSESDLKKVKTNIRMSITMFILLMSVIGCTAPAFVLYGVQFLYLEPQPTLFIVNMVLGRTCFNLMPLVDSIAIMRHREFKRSLLKLFKAFKRKICGGNK